ncbi:MAG: hypothetical protein A2Z20_11925 [Bdellovibrionales bacterium RBG_16_40_8]|nr:MAG: hypothetical protein A2Z20_11925 [Bdellovibrionales bacterium RBG_16_40_8]
MTETQKKLENLPPKQPLLIKHTLDILAPASGPKKTIVIKTAGLLLLLILIAAISFTWLSHRRLGQKELSTKVSALEEMAQLSAAAVQVYRSQGAAAAEPSFTKLLEKYPENAQLLANMGIIYLAKEEYNKAEQTLQKALASDPENTKFLTDLGTYHMAKNENEKAIEYFNKALEFDPSEPAALINRAILFEKKNQWRSAVQDYENYLKQNKFHVDLKIVIEERVRLLRSLAHMSTNILTNTEEASHVVQ